MTVQSIPQVIMAGRDIGALSRDQIRDEVIHNWHDTPYVKDALTAVAFLVDGAKREDERIGL